MSEGSRHCRLGEEKSYQESLSRHLRHDANKAGRFSHVSVPAPSPCVQRAAPGNSPHKWTKNTHRLSFISLNVCRRNHTDENVPCRTFRGIQGLLNAVTGSHCGRALHRSAPLFLPFGFSTPCFCHHYLCHQIAMMQGQSWSGPHVPQPTARQTAREKITIQSGERAAVSAECCERGSSTDG